MPLAVWMVWCWSLAAAGPCVDVLPVACLPRGRRTQVSSDALASCVVSATYNALTAAVKDGGDSSSVLTNRDALVSLYEAAHNACQPQARRRSLLARDTPATVEVQGASLSEAQLQARQALFAAAAMVSGLACISHKA